MGRKNYNSVEDLMNDLDRETILVEEEEFLSDDDLALLHGPRPPAPKPKPKRRPPVKKKPATKKRNGKR